MAGAGHGIRTVNGGGTCSRSHRMPFGAETLAEGGVRFRFWAPAHERIDIAIEGDANVLPMTPVGDGWHELITERAGSGTRYQFQLPDGLRVPDPASRFQPNDVHGPSEVIDAAAYTWSDRAWMGRAWHEAVVYELHAGAFTAEGTFRAAIEKLDHLAALGVTAIEVMPVADFPGLRNWGYDGVLLYAPDSSYGRPEDFKAFIDAAHERRLMVFLDVVYNHFGPDGNYLGTYAPQFFTERHCTPWGAAVNYDGNGSTAVREFMIHNALYWIEEFHLDGLRLDAVHALVDDSDTHLLDELAERVRAAGGARKIHLILENEENQAARLERDKDGTAKQYTAQWNDDVHHVLHTAATGEDSGYYREYRGYTEMLARALAEGFAFQGEMMQYRGRERGAPSAQLPPTAFVAFIQNHDQIGNRAFGDRLGAITSPEALRAVAAVYLLLPQIPMLFMGEEWNSRKPFPFFCDFEGELAAAVSKGRREEFARFPEFQDAAKRALIPDPEAESTFQSAKLGWDELGNPEQAWWLDWYKRILGVRHQEIVPRILSIGGNASRYAVLGPGTIAVRWKLGGAGDLVLFANLSDREISAPPPAGRVLWQEGAVNDTGLGPWAVRWSIDATGG